MTSELKNLKTHGTATMSELREFVAQMRGKSAKEMLGAVAESGLVRATIQATLGCVVLMGLFTAGPYFLAGGKAEAKSGPAAPAKASNDADAQAAKKNDDGGESQGPTATDVATGEPKKSTKTKSGDLPEPADLEKAAKKLGIGEAKSADPSVNPLDKDLDLLLEGKK